MYNEELKLALEYDGIQHYEYVPRFHKNINSLEKQQERDKFKDEKCKLNGITLIRVPYTVKYEDLESYIKKKLNDLKK